MFDAKLEANIPHVMLIIQVQKVEVNVLQKQPSLPSQVPGQRE
jgi:hypothetical protein